MADTILCEACQQLLFEEHMRQEHMRRPNRDVVWRGGEHPLHVNAQSVENALRLPCTLCVRLRGYFKSESLVDITCDVVGQSESSQYHYKLLVYFTLTKVEARNESVWLSVFPMRDTNKHLVETQLSSKTDADSSIDFLYLQYTNCKENHVNCGSPSVEACFLPNRLIEVCDASSSLVRLRHRSDLPRHARYMTLSHCWGGSQPFNLTSETSKELESGISTELLPKTFRDAFTVLSRFSIRYIWIDSLCIYQDNLDDWAAEAQSMRDIYTHAECSIAATSAKDGHMGLFFERDPLVLTPFKVEPTQSIGEPTSNNSQRPTYICDLALRGASHDLARYPLNQRAWVVQERYLSTRILQFTDSYLYWQCSEVFSSELDTNGRPNSVSAYQGDPFAMKKLLQDARQKRISEQTHTSSGCTSHAYTPRERENIYQAWCRFRRLYTSCKLTHEEDRIIALLGVAEDTAHFLKTDLKEPFDLRTVFVGCLWHSYFIRELCWSFDDRKYWNYRKEAYAPPLKPRAPTWSWASTNYAVSSHPGLEENDGSRQESLAEVLSHQVDYQLNWSCSGYIRLRCRLILASIVPVSDGRWHWPAPVDIVISSQDQESISARMSLDRPATRTLEQAFFLAVLQCYKYSTDITFTYEGVGIAASAIHPGEFERIGHFQCMSSGDHNNGDLFKFLHKNLGQFEEQIVTIV